MVAITKEAPETERLQVPDLPTAANTPSKIGILLLCLVAGLWIILAGNFIYRTSHVSVIDGVRYFTIIDDGMISMRYAKNFVQHHGLVWNVGERIEGFTDPLWTAIMVAVVWLFGTHFAPLAMQILGALICLVMFCLYCRTGINNKSSGLGIGTGILILLFSYPISYWTLGGMEAGAVCLVFTAAVCVQYSYENGNSANPLIALSGLIAVAYCLRPDGWLPITPFFLACLYDSVKERKYRRAFSACLMIGAVMALVIVARLIYYGTWVPNTYVLKVQGYSLALRLNNGRAFVGQFYDKNYFLLVLAGLAIFAKKRIIYLNVLAAFLTMGYQVYMGGDPWVYWRQLLPVYVIAAFAVLLLLDHLDKIGATGRDGLRSSRISLVIVAILISAPIIASLYQHYMGDNYLEELLRLYAGAAFASLVSLHYADKWSIKGRDSQLLTQVTRTLLVVIACGAILIGNMKFVPELTGKPYSFAEQAKLIDKAMLANKLLGAGKTHHVTWAGTYPYYVEGKMIDPLGKSDWAVARYPVDESVAWDGMKGVPGHAKYDLRDTILKRKPDVIVDHLAWGRQDLTKELQDRYFLIKQDGVSLCVRKDTAAGLEKFEAGSCPTDLLYPLQDLDRR
jgi:hypothetical protein